MEVTKDNLQQAFGAALQEPAAKDRMSQMISNAVGEAIKEELAKLSPAEIALLRKRFQATAAAVE